MADWETNHSLLLLLLLLSGFEEENNMDLELWMRGVLLSTIFLASMFSFLFHFPLALFEFRKDEEN